EQFLVSNGQYGSTSKGAEVSFWFRDSKGDMQSGSLKVDDDSPLYDAQKDEKITIRYDPRNPEKCWSEEAPVPSWITVRVVLVILFVVGFGAVILFAKR
ncbi:MAG: hypothetical protein KGN79_01010, partial [Acidobacteriota bacterium]|nr:hypothetical protein [Acidobacteriota bacterium]